MKKEFSYYTYEVGRYSPSLFEDLKTFVPYEPETNKLVWNVIDYDFNAQKIRPINLFEYNWVFLKYGLFYAKKHYANDFIKFADHVRSWLQHEYWSRAQYEVIISGWPGKGIDEENVKRIYEELESQKKNGHPYPHADFYDDTSFKIDIYTQVMLNWDRFIDYIWSNKHLITKKKLGLE